MRQSQAESIRAFFALPLGAEARAELRRVLVAFQDEPWSNRVRWVPAENLHVTLRFLGDVSPERTDGLVDRVRAVATETDPFSCTLDEVGAFPKPTRARVLIARISPAAALVDLAARVEAAVVAAGLAPETRRFRPHVTLGRVRRPPLRGVTLSASLAPIRVAADEVVLFQSDLGAGGAHYTPLARLPIGPLDGSSPRPKAGASPFWHGVRR